MSWENILKISRNEWDEFARRFFEVLLRNNYMLKEAIKTPGKTTYRVWSELDVGVAPEGHIDVKFPEDMQTPKYAITVDVSFLVSKDGQHEIVYEGGDKDMFNDLKELWDAL